MMHRLGLSGKSPTCPMQRFDARLIENSNVPLSAPRLDLGLSLWGWGWHEVVSAVGNKRSNSLGVYCLSSTFVFLFFNFYELRTNETFPGLIIDPVFHWETFDVDSFW